jgi:uncharacterized protein YebE (UPF0316 family)
MTLFFVGILEMVVVSIWTHVVNRTKVIASGVMTVVNIFIWYYVLQSVVDDIENFYLIILYALGCAVGTMITTAGFRLKYKKDQLADSNQSIDPFKEYVV